MYFRKGVQRLLLVLFVACNHATDSNDGAVMRFKGATLNSLVIREIFDVRSIVQIDPVKVSALFFHVIIMGRAGIATKNIEPSIINHCTETGCWSREFSIEACDGDVRIADHRVRHSEMLRDGQRSQYASRKKEGAKHSEG